MNIDDQRPTDRPTSGLLTHFGKISNGHNSAMRQPIPIMFGSRVGFSGTADRTAPFPVVSGRHFVNSHGRTHYPIHVMYVHRVQIILCPQTL